YRTWSVLGETCLRVGNAFQEAERARLSPEEAIRKRAESELAHANGVYDVQQSEHDRLLRLIERHAPEYRAKVPDFDPPPGLESQRVERRREMAEVLGLVLVKFPLTAGGSRLNGPPGCSRISRRATSNTGRPRAGGNVTPSRCSPMWPGRWRR